MKKLLLCIAALSLCACATTGTSTTTTTLPSTSPATYADQTKVDEMSAQTAELAYKSWRLAITAGVQAGMIKGKTATDIAKLDNTLYSALNAVESAYNSGNSATIQQAVSNFNAALSSANNVIGSK